MGRLRECCLVSGKRQGGRIMRKVGSHFDGVLTCFNYVSGPDAPAIGIWLSPSSSSPPVLTLFGSTNLNSRSAHIDTELSFMMIIPETETATTADNETSRLSRDLA